jgi:hypothetical protein
LCFLFIHKNIPLLFSESVVFAALLIVLISYDLLKLWVWSQGNETCEATRQNYLIYSIKLVKLDDLLFRQQHRYFNPFRLNEQWQQGIVS